VRQRAANDRGGWDEHLEGIPPTATMRVAAALPIRTMDIGIVAIAGHSSCGRVGHPRPATLAPTRRPSALPHAEAVSEVHDQVANTATITDPQVVSRIFAIGYAGV